MGNQKTTNTTAGPATTHAGVSLRTESLPNTTLLKAEERAKSFNEGRPKYATFREGFEHSYKIFRLRIAKENYSITEQEQKRMEGMIKDSNLETDEKLRVEIRRTFNFHYMNAQKYLYTKGELSGFIEKDRNVTTEKEMQELNQEWMRWIVKKHGARIKSGLDLEEREAFEALAEKLEDEEYTKTEWYWVYMFKVVNDGGVDRTIEVPEMSSKALPQTKRKVPSKPGELRRK